ncbi:MFS transporter [Cetobacterium sp. ZOR0034]|uniref:MFS transporter n=1 Tax=Cetobacterium sp. ZOR0034 TaxID=1339239 RepID=UPI000646C667|nr:MFS transporter [Cetobacterium sp. ZOR0034]
MEMYNRSKSYKIGLFVLNNSATNLAMFLTLYYMYYTQNILGLSGVLVGIIATCMRLFDGITDPIIGYFIDKTDGRFGKFRPFMLVGNIIIVTSLFAIFNTPLEFSQMGKYIWTTSFYVVYIIGYTFQTACTKGGQVVLTNDPKQRPLFSIFDTIYNTIIFTGGIYVLMSVIAPRYENGLLNPELWTFVSKSTVILSVICTILALIGIWEKDRSEFFGMNKSVKLKFSDYVDVLKNNRAIQMLTIAASTDKLAINAMKGVSVYLFANILLDSKLQGSYSAMTGIPITIMGICGLFWARKVGLKKSFVATTWLGMISTVIVYILGMTGASTTLFLTFMFIQQGFSAVSSPIVIPMIADVTDYELYRSGKFIPGMMGTLFSFIDKFVSSLSTTIVGFALAYAGVSKTVISPNTFISAKFNSVVLFVYCIIPILGFVASLVAMKYYELNIEKMKDIQNSLNSQKNEYEEELVDEKLELA